MTPATFSSLLSTRAVTTTALLAWLALGLPQVLALGLAGSEQARLLAGDPGLGDQFGQAVAVSGDTLVVGAPRNDDAGPNTGSTYVYRRVGTTWVQQAKLLADDAAADAFFGQAVAIDGDLIAVGAHQDTPFTGPGAAYVFARAGSAWSQVARLTASDGAINDRFGEALAISGTSVVVGARMHSVAGLPGIAHGAAYVYEQQGRAWAEQAKVVAEDAFDISFFGRSVAIHGDTLAVGADNAPGPGLVRGAAYVFVREGGLWTQQQRLSDAGSLLTDGFARSLDLEADALVVGIPFTDVAFNQSGSLQVYQRSGSTWALQAELMASDPVLGASLGRSVAISGDLIVAGAPGDDDAGHHAGSAYVFQRDGAGWTFGTKLVAATGTAGEEAGFSVTADGDTVALGGPPFTGSELFPGTAWVFTLEATPWTDLAGALAGSQGLPRLEATGTLLAGDPVFLSLTQANPVSSATLVVGLAQLLAPFKGGTLVPRPDLLLPFVTDGLGNLAFGAPWPAGVPAGLTLYFQYWIADPAGPAGLAASNGVAGTVP